MTNRYIPRLRPASFSTLPGKVAWTYVEAPAMQGLCNRPDLPASIHRYGLIETDRRLTPDEVEHFDLTPV